MKPSDYIKPFQFKPGQCGNPSGRPALPPELRAIRELTKDEVRRLFSKALRTCVPELEKLKADMAAPAIDVWLASGILKGIDQGDFTRMAFLVERVIGKIQVDGEGENSPLAAILEAIAASGLSMDTIVAHLGKKAG